MSFLLTQVIEEEEDTGLNNFNSEFHKDVGELIIANKAYKIKKGVNKIGRDDSVCGIAIESKVLSRIHAVIEVDDVDSIFIYDNESTNKTKLGKSLLKPTIRYQLNDGAEITFGNISAKFNLIQYDENEDDRGTGSQSMLSSQFVLSESFTSTSKQSKKFVPESPEADIIVNDDSLLLDNKRNDTGNSSLNWKNNIVNRKSNCDMNNSVFDAVTQCYIKTKGSETSPKSTFEGDECSGTDFLIRSTCSIDDSIFDAPTQCGLVESSKSIDNSLIETDKRDSIFLAETQCCMNETDSKEQTRIGCVAQRQKEQNNSLNDSIFDAPTQCCIVQNNQKPAQVLNSSDGDIFQAETQINVVPQFKAPFSVLPVVKNAKSRNFVKPDIQEDSEQNKSDKDNYFDLNGITDDIFEVATQVSVSTENENEKKSSITLKEPENIKSESDMLALLADETVMNVETDFDEERNDIFESQRIPCENTSESENSAKSNPLSDGEDEILSAFMNRISSKYKNSETNESKDIQFEKEYRNLSDSDDEAYLLETQVDKSLNVSHNDSTNDYCETIGDSFQIDLGDTNITSVKVASDLEKKRNTQQSKQNQCTIEYQSKHKISIDEDIALIPTQIFQNTSSHITSRKESNTSLNVLCKKNLEQQSTGTSAAHTLDDSNEIISMVPTQVFLDTHLQKDSGTSSVVSRKKNPGIQPKASAGNNDNTEDISLVSTQLYSELLKPKVKANQRPSSSKSISKKVMNKNIEDIPTQLYSPHSKESYLQSKEQTASKLGSKGLKDICNESTQMFRSNISKENTVSDDICAVQTQVYQQAFQSENIVTGTKKQVLTEESIEQSQSTQVFTLSLPDNYSPAPNINLFTDSENKQSDSRRGDDVSNIPTQIFNPDILHKPAEKIQTSDNEETHMNSKDMTDSNDETDCELDLEQQRDTVVKVHIKKNYTFEKRKISDEDLWNSNCETKVPDNDCNSDVSQSLVPDNEESCMSESMVQNDDSQSMIHDIVQTADGKSNTTSNQNFDLTSMEAENSSEATIINDEYQSVVLNHGTDVSNLTEKNLCLDLVKETIDEKKEPLKSSIKQEGPQVLYDSTQVLTLSPPDHYIPVEIRHSINLDEEVDKEKNCQTLPLASVEESQTIIDTLELTATTTRRRRKRALISSQADKEIIKEKRNRKNVKATVDFNSSSESESSTTSSRITNQNRNCTEANKQLNLQRMNTRSRTSTVRSSISSDVSCTTDGSVSTGSSASRRTNRSKSNMKSAKQSNGRSTRLDDTLPSGESEELAPKSRKRPSEVDRKSKIKSVKECDRSNSEKSPSPSGRTLKKEPHIVEQNVELNQIDENDIEAGTSFGRGQRRKTTRSSKNAFKKDSAESVNPETKVKKGRQKRENKQEPEIISTNNVQYAVAFTGYDSIQQHSILARLGGKVTNYKDSEVVITDKVRRSVKFLSALCLGKPIVSPEWLRACLKEDQFLNPWNYLLADKDAEKKWKFNLKTSLELAKKSKVLDGFKLFISPSVKPSAEELAELAQTAGSTVLSKKPHIWPEETIFLTCEEDVNLWPLPKYRYVKIMHYEFLLSGVLLQKLNFRHFKLKR